MQSPYQFIFALSSEFGIDLTGFLLSIFSNQSEGLFDKRNHCFVIIPKTASTFILEETIDKSFSLMSCNFSVLLFDSLSLLATNIPESSSSVPALRSNKTVVKDSNDSCFLIERSSRREEFFSVLEKFARLINIQLS